MCTVFALACGRAPDAPSSSGAGPKVATVSPSERPTPLRGHDSFDKVFRDGRRVRSGPVTVVIAPPDGGGTRYGIVTTRSVGNAVSRNRARRRLREALRRAELPAGCRVVVMASPEVLDTGFADLVRAIDDAIAEGR